MKYNLSLLFAAVLVLCSCGGGGLKPLTVENFTVTPSLLEESAGQVPFVLSGRFPEKYMNKKATLEVIPVLMSDETEVVAQSTASFQGERVQGNAQEISYLVGGAFTLRSAFKPYTSKLEDSRMYLLFKAAVGNKQVTLPPLLVAHGVLATASLLPQTLQTSGGVMAADKYQYSIAQQQKAQIKYLIRQTEVRSSELQTTTVQDFIKTLREIKTDENAFRIDNIEISSYASPEGNTKYNEMLAEKRGENAAKFVGGELDKNKLEAQVSSRYTAEDWEGFQELVAQSNIQDKELILRVLSMYTDPEEREKQIKNLSAAYAELADAVLPELRRSRLIINYQTLGRGDDEILQLANDDPSKLSADELLYAGTLTTDEVQKEGYYVSAAQNAPNDYRAYNNLASIALHRGDLQLAALYIDEALQRNPTAAEPNANKALLLLRQGHKGDEADVVNCLSRATECVNYKELLGYAQISEGKYGAAAASLKGVRTEGTALAQLLSGDYMGAAETLTLTSRDTGTNYYLRAIIAMRAGQPSLAPAMLTEAFKLDPSLRTKAAKDAEFYKLRDNAEFKKCLGQ
ncbi:MAG: hypothetical protein J6N92_07130 [Alloprevotella sp.]|nr:hypothetical protein [Alloprevotella sp.]